MPSDAPAERPDLALLQNTPNPFNPSTAIGYLLPSKGHATLAVYDIAGRRVATLVDEMKLAGRHSVIWDAKNEAGERVASGVYFARLECDGAGDSRRLVVLK